MRDMLRVALVKAGFDVVSAVDGEHGLEVLGESGADVIITDINMPKLDGFGFIERVREDAAHRATPILVLTTESDPAKKDRARKAGATGWIVKPFHPEKLIEAVRRVAA
jgi:two-component system chemotaxis response regulator CheY